MLVGWEQKHLLFPTFRETPLAILKLLRPSTDIVAAGVSQNIIHCLRLGDVSA